MPDAIRIEIDDAQVRAALTRLRAGLADLTPAMRDIGETLAESTKRRFASSTAPSGARWAPNSQVTILQYLARYKGSHTKAGALSAKGATRAGGKKPLIGETRSLSSQIFYQAGRDGVEVGSSMVYAAVQQFGARAKAFGRAPWGDIPARPFLGLSEQDRADILDILAGYLGE